MKIVLTISCSESQHLWAQQILLVAICVRFNITDFRELKDDLTFTNGPSKNKDIFLMLLYY